MTIGTDILAKVTSWYALDGDLTDKKGINDLNTSVVVSGYSAGIKGQQLDVASRAYVSLASPVAVGLTSGKFTIGGWMYFPGGFVGNYLMGLTFDNNSSTAEAWYLAQDSSGRLQCAGWDNSAGSGQNIVRDPNIMAKAYPVTVRAHDSTWMQADSSQIISIENPTANPQGWHFVCASWELGVMKLYLDSLLIATGNASVSVKSPTIPYFQVGIVGQVVETTAAGLDEVFFTSTDYLTQDEITWLYNAGVGRSFAELV